LPIDSVVRYPFTHAVIDGAPTHSGVYALWLDDELIYYGRADGGKATIRSRLLEHLAGALGPCTAEATHYTWEIAPEPAQRELELLKEYEAGFKRLPRCNRRAA
jgi:hypothetical protein